MVNAPKIVCINGMPTQRWKWTQTERKKKRKFQFEQFGMSRSENCRTHQWGISWEFLTSGICFFYLISFLHAHLEPEWRERHTRTHQTETRLHWNRTDDKCVLSITLIVYSVCFIGRSIEWEDTRHSSKHSMGVCVCVNLYRKMCLMCQMETAIELIFGYRGNGAKSTVKQLEFSTEININKKLPGKYVSVWFGKCAYLNVCNRRISFPFCCLCASFVRSTGDAANNNYNNYDTMKMRRQNFL